MFEKYTQKGPSDTPDKLQQSLLQFVAMGLLLQDGETFRSTFNIDQGQMLLNGQPMDPRIIQAMIGAGAR